MDKELRFQNVIVPLCEKFESVLMSFPWRSQHAYALWLAGTFHYTTHTVLLLDLCAKATEDRGLKAQYVHHLSEEEGHELLAKRDLINLGHNPDNFSETAAITRVYAYVYSQIAKSPAALQGYALFLETLSALYLP